MKTSKCFILLLATASLACLPPKRQIEFEGRLNRWVGRPISAFLLENQTPAKTSVTPGGGKVYVFESSNKQPMSFRYTEYSNLATGQRTVQAAGLQPPTWMNDGGAQQASSQDRSLTVKANLYCRVTLETDTQGIILTTRYEGNDCW